MSPCGCTAYRKYGVHDKIEYCPMHAAAREMKRFIEEVARHVYGAIDEEGVRTARALLAQTERAP